MKSTPNRTMRFPLLLMSAASVLFFFGIPQRDLAKQGPERIRLTENSDWWSGLRTIESDDSIKAQEREIAASNFRVLGVSLGENMFAAAAAKLGKTTIVERGDAAGGREQACFASIKADPKMFLIFEQGEVSYSFYFFSGGKEWTGREYCSASEKVSPTVSTASGLRLGLSPKQVIAILGLPSIRRKDELLYSLHVNKKYSEKALKELRSRYLDMSDEEFRKNYTYYDWSSGLDMKFEKGKLTYLAVSEAETI
jgi:hypothetical protein